MRGRGKLFTTFLPALLFLKVEGLILILLFFILISDFCFICQSFYLNFWLFL